MTSNGVDLEFKNRVRKLIAEKFGSDPSICGSKNRRSPLYNSKKLPRVLPNSKPEIIIIEDEIPKIGTSIDTNIKPVTQIISTKNMKQLNTDNVRTIKRQNTRITKRKMQTEKDCSLKKLKTNIKDKRTHRKRPSSESLTNEIDELNFVENTVDNDSDEDDDHNSDSEIDSIPESNFEIEKPMTCLEVKKKFGEPTMIKGTPKNVSKLSIFNSPNLNLQRPSRVINPRGNILNDFFSGAESFSLNSYSKSAVVHNATIVNQTIDEKFFNDNEENPDCDSDSSSSLNETNNDLEVEQSIVPENSRMFENNLKEKPKFYSFQNKVIAIMNPSCKFYFNGKLRLIVLMGKVEIYGFIFSQQETNVPVEIYSPRGSSLISIESVSESNADMDTENLFTLLEKEGLNNEAAVDLENKIKNLPAGTAVILLENLENTLTKFLDTYFTTKLFPKIEDLTNYHNNHPKKAEKILQAVFQQDDLGKQMKKDSYRELNILGRFLSHDSNDYQRILIAGGKGVGKSTTLRHFINGLLPVRREIVVIDFDPGQAEFTLPGCISINIVDRPLIGPNYTHLKTPFYQIFIGDVNVARCIPRYVKAAKKLVDFLNSSPRLQNRTVFVNTMGFCIDIGWDLMVYVIKLIHPSSIIQITSERSKNNFRSLLSSEVINEQKPTPFTTGEEESSVWHIPCNHELDVVPSLAEGKGKFGDFWELEPRQQRELTLLAYLSKILKNNKDSEKFSFSSLPRINDMIPYSIQLSKLTVCLMRPIVPASHILATMNGNIVALCGIDEIEKTPELDVPMDTCPKTSLRSPISTCYGFGIVRGIDISKGKILINTPLSINELQYVNAFVGSIPLPTTIICNQDSSTTPYLTEGLNLPTSREPRRGYFRMRIHNSNN